MPEPQFSASEFKGGRKPCHETRETAVERDIQQVLCTLWDDLRDRIQAISALAHGFNR